MSKIQIKNDESTNNDLLSKVNEDFTPLINLLYKAMDNYKNITLDNIKEINKILISLDNNLQSTHKIKINNIKNLLISNDKGLRTYLNDTKITLNNILIKSKEISLLYLNFQKSKSNINHLILSSEIKQKESEMSNLTKELNYYKNKYDTLNQSYLDSQKIISELKDENFTYIEKIIESDKNLYIKNLSENVREGGGSQIIKSINIEDSQQLKIENKELNNKIKELNKKIDNFESQLSRMTDKNTSLSKFLSKKNLEFTELQNENVDKIGEINKLKNQLEKINTKEKEQQKVINDYQKIINEYQKILEEKENIINNSNKKINMLNDTNNNDKLLIKTLEADKEKLIFEINNNKKKEKEKEKNDNKYLNILKDLDNCKKEKEEVEKELENIKKELEKNKNEYKKNIEIMESTIFHNNNMINEKDKMIKELKTKTNIIKENNNNKSLNEDDNENENDKDNDSDYNIENDDNNNENDNNINTNGDIGGYASNINIINKEFEEVYKQLSEKDNIIKEKDEKINELTNILENSKKDSKENIIYQKMLQYKNDELTNQSIIKVLKEQIKSLESENKSLKEESNRKKDNDLFEVVEKMLKLEKEIDKYRNKNEKLMKELDTYKNGGAGNKENLNIVEEDANISSINEISNLKSQLTDLENKYNEEKDLNKKYEEEIEKYKKDISDLKAQIIQLKHINKTNTNSTNKNIRYLNDSTNSFDIEKYNKNLEELIKARKEITSLKNQIQKLENDKKVKQSFFRCKTNEDDDNYEEEFDMAQLEEGVKKKNRSEDLNIDFPGTNETKQKYEELEERFNNLKEQVVPILTLNVNKNITKNNVTKICNLLGTSVNTTNNILEKYNK